MVFPMPQNPVVVFFGGWGLGFRGLVVVWVEGCSWFFMGSLGLGL